MPGERVIFEKFFPHLRIIIINRKKNQRMMIGKINKIKIFKIKWIKKMRWMIKTLMMKKKMETICD